MAEVINSPTKKRHGMLFRRRSPSETIATAHDSDSDPRSGRLSPKNVSIASSHAYTSRSDPLPNTSSPPTSPPQNQRQPIERAQSSEYFLQIQRSIPAREARSRRSNYNTTIHTDATETSPAFESDAFAVEMPTTREPILEETVSRTRIPKVASPSRAQVEAYETYKEKAQQVRERNNSTGVRVPSRIVCYDYEKARKEPPTTPKSTPLEKYIDSVKPSSPPRYSTSPAGSFPISPVIPQVSWFDSDSPPKSQSQPSTPVKVQVLKPTSGSNGLADSPRPFVLGSIVPVSSVAVQDSHRHHHFDRRDADAGATSSIPTPAAAKKTISARLKPRITTAAARTSDSEQQSSPKESHGRKHDSPNSSSPSSRSPSPPKSAPRFVLATDARQVAVTFPEGDIPFGFTNTKIAHTSAGSAPLTSSATAAGAKETVPNHHPQTPKPATTFLSKNNIRHQQHQQSKPSTNTKKELGILSKKWPWLRSNSPRVAKPTTTTPPHLPSKSIPISIPTEKHIAHQYDQAQQAQPQHIRKQAPPPLFERPIILTTPSPTSNPTTTKPKPKLKPDPKSKPKQTPLTTTPKKLTRPPPPQPASPPPSTPPHSPFPSSKILPPPSPSTSLHHGHSSSSPSSSSPNTKRHIETGLAQITYALTLVVKIVAVVYLLVLAFYVLDAVRLAMGVLGAPFRAVRVVVEGLVGGVVGVVVWGVGSLRGVGCLG